MILVEKIRNAEKKIITCSVSWFVDDDDICRLFCAFIGFEREYTGQSGL